MLLMVGVIYVQPLARAVYGIRHIRGLLHVRHVKVLLIIIKHLEHVIRFLNVVAMNIISRLKICAMHVLKDALFA